MTLIVFFIGVMFVVANLFFLSHVSLFFHRNRLLRKTLTNNFMIKPWAGEKYLTKEENPLS